MAESLKEKSLKIAAKILKKLNRRCYTDEDRNNWKEVIRKLKKYPEDDFGARKNA